MKKFIIISFFTIGTPYEVEVQRLINSLSRLNIKNYEIIGIEDQGSWRDNTNYKPLFISQLLNKHRMPVLWIDADAEVHSSLDYFQHVDCDICAFYRNGKELLTGTIYFNYTVYTLSLINWWLEQVRYSPDLWEQRNLQHAIESYSSNNIINIVKMPPEYCFFDLMKVRGEFTGEPVIEHFQASRAYNPNHPAKGRFEFTPYKYDEVKE